MAKSSVTAKTKRTKEPHGDPLSQHLGQRILALREARGWSLDALATASGVSRSMLSEIERCTANPTLLVTHRIAQAFGLRVGELIEPQQRPEPIQVIRATERSQVIAVPQRYQVRPLSPLTLEKNLEFYEVCLPINGELVSQPHMSGTQELLVVARGTVEIHADMAVQTLTQGDAALFPADVRHALRNVGKDDVVIYLVDLYR